MTNTIIDRPVVWTPEPGPRRRRTSRWLVVTLALVTVVAVAVGALAAYRYITDDSRRDYLGADDWPQQGQAAIQVDNGRVQTSPVQRPAPIASMAKVMTAYLVLRQAPITRDEPGFRMRVTAADVRRTAEQRSQDQSVVPLDAGGTLSERDALMALMLPSANNVAEMLARTMAGSVRAFVGRMNDAAKALGMRSTRYTDPSGYDARTVSTAVDQVILARTIAGNDTLSAIAATRSYELPGAGTVRNTDELLGRDGFIGTKTGSHDAAGGCFMFRVRRAVDGRWTDVYGVVMGQQGHSLIRAGLYAAKQLADRTLD